MKKGFVKEILEFIIGLVVALIIVFSVKHFIIERIRVVGTSMYPTLDDQQTVWCYKLGKVDREDIVIVNSKFYNGKQLIKRVIGMPGDTVIIEDSTISIIDKDGNPVTLREDYNTTKISPNDHINIKLSDDEFFLVGDNRAVSRDSRELGPVPADMILGVILNK